MGFRITTSGIRPDTEKIMPIKEAAVPKSLKQTQAFLGAVNYLSEFIPNFSDKAEPLRFLTSKV